MKKLLLVVVAIFICLQLVGCQKWVVRSSSSYKPRVDQAISGNRGFIFGQPTSPPKAPAFTERKVYRIEVEIPDLKPKKKTPPPAQQEKSTQELKEEEGVQKQEQDAGQNKGIVFGKPEEELDITQEQALIQPVMEIGEVEKAIKQPKKQIMAKKEPVIPEAATFGMRPQASEAQPPVAEIKQAVSEIETPTIKLEQPATKVKKPAGKTGETIAKVATAALEVKPEPKIELRTYKVEKGDTLQKISRKFYGTTKRWAFLYKANKDSLKNPDTLYPGQVLVIPEFDK